MICTENIKAFAKTAGIILCVISIVVCGVFYVIRAQRDSAQILQNLIQSQSQTQSQTQQQSTMILTVNVGAQGQPCSVTGKYRVVVFRGYTWKSDETMTQVIAYINSLDDIPGMFGVRVFPAYGYITTVYYVCVPVFTR